MTDDAEERDEDGYLLIRYSGTIYLGKYKWWTYTNDPKVLHCTVCNCKVTNVCGAISNHAKRHPPEKQ